MGIKLFGHKDCHKTKIYQSYLKEKGIEFDFLDVHEDDAAADELRSLYTTGKLNFPTILVGTKKLRNPKFKDLDNYLGERARRGRKLPRGFQKVDALEVDAG